MKRLRSVILILAGITCLASPFLIDWLEPFVQNEDGTAETTTVARLLHNLIWAMACRGHLLLPGLYIGVALFAHMGIPGASFLRDQQRARVRASLAASTLSMLLILGVSWPFFLVEPGSSIRPMGWSALMFILALLNAAIAIPLAVMSLWTEDCKRLAGFSILWALCPLPAGIAILAIAMKIGGWTMDH